MLSLSEVQYQQTSRQETNVTASINSRYTHQNITYDFLRGRISRDQHMFTHTPCTRLHTHTQNTFAHTSRIRLHTHPTHVCTHTQRSPDDDWLFVVSLVAPT